MSTILLPRLCVQPLRALAARRALTSLAHRPQPTLLPTRVNHGTHALHRASFWSSSIQREYQKSQSSVQGKEKEKVEVSESSKEQEKRIDRHENIWTIPNALTLSRILACPVLGWSIVKGDFHTATALLVYAGVSDGVDGWLARRFNMRTVLGSILDPAADKLLMTTLTVTLAINGLLPVWLATFIIGRDVALSISAFYYRYISLPPPKTFKRYWDFSIPSAEVRPTEISKYNTFLQLLLMGSTTVAPLLSMDVSTGLQALQYVVAGTTVWSGWSYIGSKTAVKILK